jgi:hypothetical protein
VRLDGIQQRSQDADQILDGHLAVLVEQNPPVAADVPGQELGLLSRGVNDRRLSLERHRGEALAQLAHQVNESRLRVFVRQPVAGPDDGLVDPHFGLPDRVVPGIGAVLFPFIGGDVPGRLAPVALGQLGLPFLVAAAFVLGHGDISRKDRPAPSRPESEAFHRSPRPRW